MTREDVVLCLKGIKKLGNDFFTPRSTKDFNESLDIAISEFEKQPSDDCVSRESVIEELNRLGRNAWKDDTDYDRFFAFLDNLPPTRKEWIPVSERLPEEHEWIGTKQFGTTISDEVYVTFGIPNGGRFCDHVRFQNGKLSPAERAKVNAIAKNAEPIAWMPLPEPYKAESEVEE